MSFSYGYLRDELGKGLSSQGEHSVPCLTSPYPFFTLSILTILPNPPTSSPKFLSTLFLFNLVRAYIVRKQKVGGLN